LYIIFIAYWSAEFHPR